MSENLQVFTAGPNLLERIEREGNLSTFAKLLRTSRAIEIFRGDGDYTVFAPTNEAFGKIDREIMEELIDETGQATLRAVLSYHVVPGIFTAADLREMTSTRTITGTEVSISNNGRLRINASTVKARNLQASDGILHAIDTVLVPAFAAAEM